MTVDDVSPELDVFQLPVFDKQKTTVYFLINESNTAIKIGYSSDITARIRALKTANPEKLHVMRVVFGDRQTEQWFHRRFSNSRIKGEWFKYSPDMLDAIPPGISWREYGNKEITLLGQFKARISQIDFCGLESYFSDLANDAHNKGEVISYEIDMLSIIRRIMVDMNFAFAGDAINYLATCADANLPPIVIERDHFERTV